MTPKQEKFAQEYIANGGNATQAALAAGYNPNSAYAMGAENLKKPVIAAAIEAHRAKSREKHAITVESLTQQYQAAHDAAQRDGQHSASVSALNGIMKLHGLEVDPRRNAREPLEIVLNGFDKANGHAKPNGAVRDDE